MKIFKKLLTTSMALVLSAGIFVGMPIKADAAGNISDAYVGTYLYSGGQTVTVTKDNVSISGIAPGKGERMEVVVNDNTVPSAKADVALKISVEFEDGTAAPYGYFALSFADSSHNVLKVTKYSRSGGYAMNSDGTALTFQWGEWKADGSCEYQRQGVTEQPAQEVKAETAAQDTKATEVKAEAKTPKANNTEAKKSYSAYIYSGTTTQELVKELLHYIDTAKAGSTIEFTGKPIMMCYSQTILDKLAERGDVSLKTTFTYNGVTESFTIPAGSDYSNLEGLSSKVCKFSFTPLYYAV